MCKFFQKCRPLRKKLFLSPVCTSETEDLEDVISDEQNKLEESSLSCSNSPNGV